jgi:hypothetical protein
MPLKYLLKIGFRFANQLAASVGLRIEKLDSDFSIRPLDELSKRFLAKELATAYGAWFSNQDLFDDGAGEVTPEEVQFFFESWIKSPFQRQTGSSRFNNLLWLYLLSKRFQPEIIVDSGTFEGASAWALSLGSPKSKIFSFDISLERLALRVGGVEYFQHDWTKSDFAWPKKSRTLVYFDDHVDQVRRLMEAFDRNFSLAIFDDDYPVTSYYSMAPSNSVLPKIEFMLNEELKDGTVLRWGNDKIKNEWTVNLPYLLEARGCVDKTERLPFTGLITGIHQTPFRLVKLKE